MHVWLIKRFVFPYWRMIRGMTLGVQGVITRDGREVLLVRHGYRPGWHFPGGGVEWHETLIEALAREVKEETGVIVKGEPRLHGMFANFQAAPCDHIALYIIDDWDYGDAPAATFEIQEQRFFPLAALPDDMVAGARRRLGEIYKSHAIGQHW
jgi:ADP-ribose pyrophosphatase YjhB (NUDIX family)